MPFGLEFVLVLAALSIVVFVACVLPMVFQVRRRVMRSLLLAEHTKGRVDQLLDECRRAARAVAIAPPRVGVLTFLQTLFSRTAREHSRKETRYV